MFKISCEKGCQTPGMYYDPNTDEYYDENGTYYYWDEDSQSFVEAY